MLLTKLQKQLCNLLQNGLLVCQRPFEKIAKSLNTDEKAVLQQIEQLKEAGIIRRIAALLNYRALGMTATLVTAHIPQQNLNQVTQAVNSLKQVSHNYLRSHFYNLWFTIQAESNEQIDSILSNLSADFSFDFHSLPAEHVFKLDVRFDAESEGKTLLPSANQIPAAKPLKLNENQKLILSKLQNDLQPTAKPFDFLSSQALPPEDALKITQQLIDKGVIRRIAAVVDYRRLGFVANALFVSEVAKQRIIDAGRRLSALPMVSHCYQRKTFENWPYNLFAMMHSRSLAEIEDIAAEFTKTERITSFEILSTTAELKKQAVKYKF